MSREEIRQLRREGQSIRDIARQYDLPERKVDRWCGDIAVTPTKPTRGAVPKGIREAPDPRWMRPEND